MVLLFGVAMMLLAGCDLPTSQPTAVPGALTPTPLPSEPTEVPTDTVDATPPAPAIITLTVWTTDAFSPTETITSGQILAREVRAFEDGHADVRLEFVPKKPHGQGGILDYLLTTAPVVPGLLPDLVLVDVDELGIAVQAELLRPLDELLPADLVADLYPFAVKAGTVDERLYALQYQADLDHLVYSTGRMAVPPSSWPGVLSNPGPYIFPAGGQAGLVNDDFLMQYLAVRPWPGANSEEPFLNEDALVAVFQYYQDGVARGIFPAEIADFNSTDDTWRRYLEGETAMAHVSAHQYLSGGDRAPSSAAAPIPAISGPAAAIGRGWALALVTVDPVRQSAAVEFMTQLMAPETNAALNQAQGYLPTLQSALSFWTGNESYVPFMAQQLRVAQARPPIPQYARTAAALQQGVADVVSGSATPEEAAARVIEQAQ